MKECKVDSCHNKHKGHGYCVNHLSKIKKYSRIPDYDVPYIEYLEGEVFKDLIGYETLYKASNKGRIYSCVKGTIMAQCYNKNNGYMTVTLFKDGKQKTHYIHRLVLETFEENIHDKPQVDHINTIRTDNTLENLRWCTSIENHLNDITHNKFIGENNWAYGTEKQVKGTNLTTGEEIYLISTHGLEKEGFNAGAIWRCCKGIQKSYRNYKWEWINDGK